MQFVLEFSDSDFEGKGWAKPITEFRFPITMPFEFGSDEYEDWDDEILLDQVSDMEEYGVHDFMASGLPDGRWVEFGYHSYEIPQDKWTEVVEKWHQWFNEQGFEPGEITSEEKKEEE